jgi:hypothetical protein
LRTHAQLHNCATAQLHNFDAAFGGRRHLEGAPVSAAEALQVARSFGIRLVVDGDDLVLKGSAPPPPQEQHRALS